MKRRRRMLPLDIQMLESSRVTREDAKAVQTQFYELDITEDNIQLLITLTVKQLVEWTTLTTKRFRWNSPHYRIVGETNPVGWGKDKIARAIVHKILKEVRNPTVGAAASSHLPPNRR